MNEFGRPPCPENQYLAYTEEWIFSKYTGLNSTYRDNQLPSTNRGLSLDDLSRVKVGWSGKLVDLPIHVAKLAHKELFWEPYGIEHLHDRYPKLASILTYVRVTAGHDTMVKIMSSIRRQMEYYCIQVILDATASFQRTMVIAANTIGADKLGIILKSILAGTVLVELSRLPGYELFGQEIISLVALA